MQSCFLPVLAGILLLALGPAPAQDPALSAASLWNVPQLLATPPAVETGAAEGLTKPVWYAGESYQGKPTRIFAWLGEPAGGAVSGKHPAVLLVHGGGGKAFQDWARHWAERGYVALAMDTAGQGPDGKRHAEGGPGQDDGIKFKDFTNNEAKDMWTYHAVAAVLRGHALLASFPQVDAARIGVTGISWGGYLTCLTAGLDPELKAAVPVYGCGFLGDNSIWRDRSLAALPLEARDRWLQLFDPSQVIGKAVCPVMMVNGTHDFAYPPDSHGKTGRLIPAGQRQWSLRVDMAHGHIWNFPEVDAFMDQHLKPGSIPLVRLGEIRQEGEIVTVPVGPGTAAAGASLHFTTDTGVWQNRRWETRPATVTGSALTVSLPAERPLAFFLAATDARGFTTSTDCQETGAGANTATVPRDRLEQDFYDWNQRHEAILKAGPALQPEIVFIGDSITHLWGGVPDDPKGNRGKEAWDQLLAGRPALNLGFGWDRTQNVLWRIDHGELDGLKPQHLVVLIGTNNLAGTPNARENTPAEIAEGIAAVVWRAKAKCPGAKVVLMAVFPRGATPDQPVRRKVAAINALLPEVARETGAELLDIRAKFCEADGTISKEIMPDALHPGPQGYAVWAEALRPLLAR